MSAKLGLWINKNIGDISRLPIKRVTDKNGHMRTVHYNPDKDSQPKPPRHFSQQEKDSKNNILPKIDDYNFSDDKYYRRTKTGNLQNNDADYYMFVQGKDPGNYGDFLFEYDGKNSIHIIDLKDKLIENWHKDKENGRFGNFMDSNTADYYEKTDIDDEDLIDMFNPERIVDSAVAFDDPALVSWFYERVLGSYDSVLTRDGAIIFNRDLGELVAKKSLGLFLDDKSRRFVWAMA